MQLKLDRLCRNCKKPLVRKKSTKRADGTQRWEPLSRLAIRLYCDVKCRRDQGIILAARKRNKPSQVVWGDGPLPKPNPLLQNWNRQVRGSRKL